MNPVKLEHQGVEILHVSQGSCLKSAHSLLVGVNYHGWITKELTTAFLSKGSSEKILKANQFHISYGFSFSDRNPTSNTSQRVFSSNSHFAFIPERILQVTTVK